MPARGCQKIPLFPEDIQFENDHKTTAGQTYLAVEFIYGHITLLNTEARAVVVGYRGVPTLLADWLPNEAEKRKSSIKRRCLKVLPSMMSC